MKRFYSPQMGTTYLDTVHFEMPADVLEITEEVYDSVFANPAPGKVRANDANGYPILIERPPLTDEELASIERAWRDAELFATDPLVARHRDQVEEEGPTTLTAAQYKELQVYRKHLREWPESNEFPDSAGRPVAPEWLPSQPN